MNMISLLTGIGFVVTLLAGFTFASRLATSCVAPKGLFGFIIGFGLLCRIVFLLFVPVGLAPDEGAHYNYIQWIATHSTLPVETNHQEEEEFYQPPAYYILLTPVLQLCKIVRLQERGIYYTLRLVNLLLWLGVAACTWKFLLLREEVNTLAKTVTLCFVSLVPTHVYLSSMINNDNIVVLIGSGVYLLIFGTRLTWKTSILLGLLLGVGILSKLSALIFVVMVLLRPGLRWFSPFVKSRLDETKARFYLLPVVISMLMSVPLALRNIHFYGSITAEQVGNIRISQNSISYSLRITIQRVAKQFWATFHHFNHPATFYPFIGIIFSLIAIYGLLRVVQSENKAVRQTLAAYSDVVLITLPIIVLQLALIFAVWMAIWHGPGPVFISFAFAHLCTFRKWTELV